MSLTEFQLTDVYIKIESSTSINLLAGPMPEVVIIAAGNVGPPGPQGQWVSMTQAEYDAITSPDPDTLYVII